MKKFIFIFFTLFVFFSCAQFKSTGANDNLYNQYLKYISLLSEQNNIAAVEMLSERNITDLTTHSNLSEFAIYFPIISSINEVFVKEIGAFEEIHDNKGCLTVFGLDPSNEPTSLYLEYGNENGYWKLDYVQVMYHGHKDELPKKVMCPTRI